MALLDRVVARRTQALTRSWPVGLGTVSPWETTTGHDDQRFSPEFFGDYLAKSNDIYSVVSARARLLSGLDLKFYKGRGTKKKEVDSGRPVDLYRWVNAHWTASRLARMDEMSMGVWGESYWALEPPNRTNPLGEIWWLKASRVRPAPDVLDYLDGYLYYPQMGGQPIHFTNEEIVWFRYPNPIDEFSPLSPLAAARLAADTASSMMKSNQQLFDQGMQLAGLVTPPSDKMVFSQKQVEDLEAHMKSRFSGPKNAHRWAVLRYEAQFKQMGVTPKDAEFVAGLGMTFRQVCRAYGMQAALHNDLEQASPGDTAALGRLEWSRALAPDAVFRADEIREQYLPRFLRDKDTRGLPDHCEFDFTAVPELQESQSEVWDRDTAALDRGMITINEWRNRNGMASVAWGNEPWLPLNKAQYIDGKLQVPGQPQMGAGGLPQDAVQGGPQQVDGNGVPAKKPPDDEVNPSNKPQRGLGDLTHMQSRELLAAFDRRVNGYAHSG